MVSPISCTSIGISDLLGGTSPASGSHHACRSMSTPAPRPPIGCSCSRICHRCWVWRAVPSPAAMPICGRASSRFEEAQRLTVERLLADGAPHPAAIRRLAAQLLPVVSDRVHTSTGSIALAGHTFDERFGLSLSSARTAPHRHIRAPRVAMLRIREQRGGWQRAPEKNQTQRTLRRGVRGGCHRAAQRPAAAALERAAARSQAPHERDRRL